MKVRNGAETTQVMASPHESQHHDGGAAALNLDQKRVSARSVSYSVRECHRCGSDMEHAESGTRRPRWACPTCGHHER